MYMDESSIHVMAARSGAGAGRGPQGAALDTTQEDQATDDPTGEGFEDRDDLVVPADGFPWWAQRSQLEEEAVLSVQSGFVAPTAAAAAAGPQQQQVGASRDNRGDGMVRVSIE